MKKLLLVLLFPVLLFGAQKGVEYDTITHGVIKPPHSTSTIYDLDFTGLTIGGLAGGGGGGGTPGGANQQLQFNNSFTLGGVPYATFDGSAVTFRSGARFILADPTDATKRVQIALANPTGTLKTLTISDNSVTVIPGSVTPNQFVTNINTLGVVVTAQPLFSNIGGLLSLSQTSMATNKLLGRGTAGTGAAEEITLGTNLTLTGTTLNATGGGGGTPGGADTQFQYNNATAFGGTTNLVLSGGQVKAVDANFVLKNISDATKQMTFSLAGVPTGTTETVIVANAANPVIPKPDVGAANNFLTGISSSGIITKAQVDFTNISGTLGLAQQNFPIAKERFVDPVNGSDITGAANLAKPYLTIAAACAAASSGDVIYLYPNLTGYDQGVTALVIPAGVTIVGSGPDSTLIKSALTGVTRMAVEPSTASAVYNVTIQNTSSTGGAFGVGSASTAFTSAYIGGCKILGNQQGIYLNKAGTTGLIVENTTAATQNDAFFQNVSTAVSTMRNCDFQADGTTSAESKGLNVTNGTVRFNYGTLTVGGSTTTNVGAFGSGAGAIIELHGVRISNSGGGATNYDMQQQSSATVGKDNVYRSDAAALVTNGTITELSRYAVIDNNLTDFPNIGAGTRGDIIYRGASGWTKLIAGIDGNVLTTHGNTADPTWATAGTGATVSDTIFSSAWNGQTVTAPSQNAVYDQLHKMDPDDNGKVNTLDQGNGIANTDLAGTLLAPILPPASALVGVSDTQTLTNKRITKRSSAVSAPPATITINTDNFDVLHYTGMNTAITGFTMSGTPVQGDTLRMDFTDDGTARAITWSADFEASPGQVLPTTTTASTRMDVGFVWNTASGKWRCVASTNPVSGTGGGSGTVTSVGLTGANGITVTGTNPITTSGSHALSLPITLAGTAGKTLTVNNSVTLAGTDGVTLNVGTTGGTLGSNAFTSTAFLTATNISDAVWAAAWNGDTTTAPSRNAIYDWGHTFDTDDNGKVNVLDLTTAELVKTNTSGVVSSAVGGTDYANLAFKTVSVSGQSDVVADTASDTLTLAAGSNVTITTTPGTDTVTIASTGGGAGAVPTGTGFYHTTAGVMDSASVTATGSGNVARATNAVMTGTTITDGFYLQGSNSTLSFAIFGARASDSSPVGHFETFKNAAQTTTLWDVDVTGTLQTGIIPWARITGSAGSTTQVLFNDAGTVAGDAGLVFNKTSKLLTVGGYVYATPDASIAVPAFSFVGDTGTGIFDYTAASTMGFMFAANRRVVWDTTQVRVASGYEIGWSSSTDSWTAVTDTGFYRNAAGVVEINNGTPSTYRDLICRNITISGGNFSGRINPRATGGCEETTSTTSTPTADSCDQWDVTALAATTDTFAAPTGTPVNGQKLIIRIKDNGTARILAWNAIYRASTDLPLPLTTVISKTLYMGFIYNSADSKWDLIASLNNF